MDHQKSSPFSARPTTSSSSSDRRSSTTTRAQGDVMPNYRPWLMHPCALSIFCILPLFVIAITEWIHQTSHRGTGVFRKGDRYKTREKIAEIIPTYATLFVVVFTGFFYSILDIHIKAMEPFYQISKQGGATGKDSLCVDYFRQSLFVTPFTAICHKHWAVVCSSLATIIHLNVLPPLVIGIFEYDKFNNWGMDTAFTYALEGTLGLMSLLMIFLTIIVSRRRSGVPHAPNSFAALMRFTSNMEPGDSLYELFKRLGDEITEEELDKEIGSLLFEFKYSQDPNTGRDRFDIVLLGSPPPIETPPSFFQKISNVFKGIIPWLMGRPWVLRFTQFRRQWLWKDNHPMIFQEVPLAVIIFLLTGLFIVITGQPFWARNSRFFTFLGSKRFVRSTISTFIHSTIWIKVFRYSLIYEPIYSMCVPEGGLYNTLYSSYVGPSRKLSSYIQYTGLLGLLASKIFIVTWNNLNDSGAVFTFSFFAMVLCEVVMLLILLLLFIYRRHPFLPRQPITLASNLLFVYATDIPKEIVEKIVRVIEGMEPPTVIGSGEGGDMGAGEEGTSVEDVGPGEEGKGTGVEGMGCGEEGMGGAEGMGARDGMEPGGDMGPVVVMAPGVSARVEGQPSKHPGDKLEKDAEATPSSPPSLPLSQGHRQGLNGDPEIESCPPQTPAVSPVELSTDTIPKPLEAQDKPRVYTGSATRRCAFGQFKGRDGKDHVGIGKYGGDMRPYKYIDPGEEGEDRWSHNA